MEDLQNQENRFSKLKEKLSVLAGFTAVGACVAVMAVGAEQVVKGVDAPRFSDAKIEFADPLTMVTSNVANVIRDAEGKDAWPANPRPNIAAIHGVDQQSGQPAAPLAAGRLAR